MKHYSIFVMVILVFSISQSPIHTAQADKPLSDYPIITAENVSQLEQLKVLGEGYIRHVIFSPDEQFVAMASSVGIWLYPADDLDNPIRLFGNYDIDVTYAMFSADGSRLFGGVQGGSVYIWDVASGELITTLTSTNDISYQNPFIKMELSDDGVYLYVITDDYLTIWNLSNYISEKNILLHESNYDYRTKTTRILSPDKRHILIHHLAGQYNGNSENQYINSSVTVIDIQTNDNYTLEHTYEFQTALFDDTGTKIITALITLRNNIFISGSTGIWDVDTGELLHQVGEEGAGYKPLSNYAKNKPSFYDGITPDYQNALISHDQSKLILFMRDHVQIWDIESNLLWGYFLIDNTLHDAKMNFMYEITSFYPEDNETELLQFIKDENLLYRIPLWYYPPRPSNFFGYEEPDLIYLSPQNNYFLSHSTDAVRIWNREIEEFAFEINFAKRCNPDGYSQLILNDSRLFVTKMDQNDMGVVCIWDVSDETFTYQYSSARPANQVLVNRYFVIFNKKDESLGQPVQIHDLITNTFFETTERYDTSSTLAIFSPNEKHLILSSFFSDEIHIWDLENQTLVQELKVSGYSPREVVFSPDNQKVAMIFQTDSVSGRIYDNPIRVWNTADWSLAYPIEGFENYIPSVFQILFSPNSDYLLISGNFIQTRMTLVLDSETSELLYAIPPEIGDANFHFNYDSTQLAFPIYRDETQSIRILDVSSGDIYQDIDLGLPTTNPPLTYSMSYSPKTNLLAIRPNDGIIQIWDTNTRLLIHTLPFIPAHYKIKFNDNGNLFIIEGNGILRIWGVNTP